MKASTTFQWFLEVNRVTPSSFRSVGVVRLPDYLTHVPENLRSNFLDSFPTFDLELIANYSHLSGAFSVLEV